MNQWPLNARRALQVWEPFAPGDFLDFNASFVRVSEDLAFAVFRRECLPPVPGQGKIWVATVGADMQPTGSPMPLLDLGEDPRALYVGERVLVLYVLPELNEHGSVVGTSMALAEFTVEGQQLKLVQQVKLPKAPLGGVVAPDSIPGWEKNWVPFCISESKIGLIYSHDPWDVIVLNVDPTSSVRRFESHHRAHGLHWGFGPVRGGTPPIDFDERHHITFFHSALMVGSRKMYMVGACIFEKKAPYRPVMFTPEPVLIAPHYGDVGRFGWKRPPCSVVFPLGVQGETTGWRLLCGVDDGEIATVMVQRDEVYERLHALSETSDGRLHNYEGQAFHYAGGPLLHVPKEVGGIAELPIIKFIEILAGRGRIFVDVGAHIGFYTVMLAPGFQRVEAFEPSRFQLGWLRRNVSLNACSQVAVHAVALGEVAGEATLHVLSSDGGVNTLAQEVALGRPSLATYTCPVERLDDRALDGVDLLKIDVEGFEMQVLRGARRTIAASRPIILMEVWDELARRAPIRDWLMQMGYTMEFVFSSAPELALCFPQERRADYAWLV